MNLICESYEQFLIPASGVRAWSSDVSVPSLYGSSASLHCWSLPGLVLAVAVGCVVSVSRVRRGRVEACESDSANGHGPVCRVPRVGPGQTCGTAPGVSVRLFSVQFMMAFMFSVCAVGVNGSV